MALHIPRIRQQFPILRATNPPLYLDSAATAQVPDTVLKTMEVYHRSYRANVHRGMHTLAERATEEYERARTTVQHFIAAEHPTEIVFTKNCTEAINLIAKTWGRSHVHEGNVVVLSMLEHHSNVVPWLQLKEEKGIDVAWIDIDDEGKLRMEQLDEFLKRGNVKLVAITGQSNVLGVRPNLSTIIRRAHAAGALALVDAAQLIAHHPINVQEFECDFLTFSGHKLYGPTGIGVLYGKGALLESMPPFLGGGMMIHEVHTDHYSPADPPAKFEAGTPPIAEAIGLRAAIEWLSQLTWKDIEAHEQRLLHSAYATLRDIDDLTILGPKNLDDVFGCLSFTIDRIHPHDLTEILGRQGIALRAGHHCTQPLHRRLGITASTRLSIGIYNTNEEIEECSVAIQEARKRLT